VAFDRYATDLRSRHSVMQLFGQLESPLPLREGQGRQLPVCKRFLSAALALETSDPVLRNLLDRFVAIEPMLEWKTLPIYYQTASPNLPMGHGNAKIVGPQGIEDRADVSLGVTLMAPNIRYPDHNGAGDHSGLVVSEGELIGKDGWLARGPKAFFYNPIDTTLAIRSSEKRLLIFWASLPNATRH
jgi:Dimethlysulfonioproprionate lyase